MKRSRRKRTSNQTGRISSLKKEKEKEMEDEKKK